MSWTMWIQHDTTNKRRDSHDTPWRFWPGRAIILRRTKHIPRRYDPCSHPRAKGWMHIIWISQLPRFMTNTFLKMGNTPQISIFINFSYGHWLSMNLTGNFRLSAIFKQSHIVCVLNPIIITIPNWSIYGWEWSFWSLIFVDNGKSWWIMVDHGRQQQQ